MPKLAIVAAVEREVGALIRSSKRVRRDHEGRKFTFFEQDDMVIVCGGIGVAAARRAAEAAIALYHPTLLLSVGFAGALQSALRVGDIFAPAVVLDARDGSRVEIEGGEGVLLTFMAVAGIRQKASLAQSYGAQAVDMEAAAVAAAARARGIRFGATKAISDEFDFEMPELDTARFIDSQGRFRTASFALFLALRPWLWRRVALLATNSNQAARMLAARLNDFHRSRIDAVEAKTT